MHYVSVEGLTKSYGINPLFRNISFHINEGDKIGLIARNGVGKSTLLRILAGQETADSGKSWINKDVTVALFEQDPHFEEDKTVLENIFHLKHPIITAIRKYEDAMEQEDGEMIEWLEQYLNQENVTLLLVTHDRYFLDAVCEEIWELERENMYVYTGTYENYMEKKAARIESELASIDKAKNQFRKELEWMRKQPKARTTKSKSRQDNFYEVEAKAKQKIEDVQLQLEVKMSRLGGKIVEMKKVYKSFADKPILKGFDYNFSKGERIGIIGKNGVGKSTFMNVLQQLEPADSGKIVVGDTIVFGNFSQQGLVIKEDMRVIEYVKTFAENFPLAKGGSLSAAQFLELFLFSPDKQYTYLSALSGGERKRLQLLTILFTNPNFLILDEPTNDLDLPTLAVLENFLSEYQGCVMIVSHDRYFMDRLVDHLFVFEGEGEVRDFPGNYTQYRIWLKDNEKKDNKWAVLESNKSKGQTTEEAVVAKAAAVVSTAPAAPKRKPSFNEKRAFEQLEKEMPLLEKERQDLTDKMSGGNLNFDQIQQLSDRLIQINQALEEKELQWLELSELM
ncbi:MAG: ABC transporter [Bacteroidetes bacterium 24-39-8]|nr:MAG: ABC transporter [Bacteroidetes bacterium 24-39-8]